MNRTVYDQVPISRGRLSAAIAHETSRFLGCFAGDGAVDDWGRVFTGHAQVRRWSVAEFIGKKRDPVRYQLRHQR